MIFIAIPQRGSRMASGWIGRAGGWLAVIPESFRGLYHRLALAEPEALRGPLADALKRGRLIAIHTLTTHHPVLAVLNDLPFGHGAETHSIIGKNNPAVPLEASTDGVVPYASSHFPQAVSEVVVTSGHDAFRPREAFQEVRRILLMPPR